MEPVTVNIAIEFCHAFSYFWIFFLNYSLSNQTILSTVLNNKNPPLLHAPPSTAHLLWEPKLS